jgi:hypothetical protein
MFVQGSVVTSLDRLTDHVITPLTLLHSRPAPTTLSRVPLEPLLVGLVLLILGL